MRTVDRQGIHIDQCDGCRGIFLDRGELERLVDAEGRHYAGDREERREYHREDYRPYKGKHKKRSFLENLFEGGD